MASGFAVTPTIRHEHSDTMKTLPFPLESKHLLACLACALTFTTAFAQDLAFLTNGLVGFYRLDGDAKDSSSNRADGVATALKFQTNRFGLAGSAGSFDGVDSRVRVPLSADFNLLPVTATAWVRLGANQGTDLGIVSTYFTASANGWGIFVNGNVARTWYYGQQGSVPEPFLIAPTPIATPKWYHLAAAYDSTGGRLYVDGQLVVSHGWTGTPSPSASQQGLLLGEMLAMDGTHSNFRGQIDDVRIYSRKLSDSEIKALYDHEKTLPSVVSRPATATANAVNGFVVGLTVTDAGSGYAEPPVVIISGGGGTGATANAVVSKGVVTGFVVTNAGIGYTSVPTVRIASPPFAPEVAIRVSRVSVDLKVVLGRKYQLQASKDLVVWTATGPDFVADAESLTQEFVVAEVGSYFRVVEVP